MKIGMQRYWTHGGNAARLYPEGQPLGGLAVTVEVDDAYREPGARLTVEAFGGPNRVTLGEAETLAALIRAGIAEGRAMERRRAEGKAAIQCQHTSIRAKGLLGPGFSDVTCNHCQSPLIRNSEGKYVRADAEKAER